jgi:hypothetical protein
MDPNDRTQTRASVATAVIALFALGVSFFSWFQTEQRSKAAEERTLKAERETHAALVVFHIEAVGDPQVSKTVLGGFMVVANFGHFPIEDVAIEEPGTVEIGGKDERIVTSIPIGTPWAMRARNYS